MTTTEPERKVHVHIKRTSGTPIPVHAFLNGCEGTDGRWHYYFLHWGPKFENPIASPANPDANFRYGYQCEAIWGGENVEVLEVEPLDGEVAT